MSCGFLVGRAHPCKCIEILQRLAVQLGMIALDEARLLQRTDAAQAGWRGDLGAARQLHIGDAAVGLQLGQYAQVYGVQLAGIHERSWRGNGPIS